MNTKAPAKWKEKRKKPVHTYKDKQAIPKRENNLQIMNLENHTQARTKIKLKQERMEREKIMHN